jgi:hypothetical protein
VVQANRLEQLMQNTTAANETFSLASLGICLTGSLALFVYQLAEYTTLLG